MGDIVSGLYGGGTSGSLGYGKGNNKTQMTYLGERAGQAPLEDIMGLLASEANQQRAQSNLINFGAGYGGSFESADQRAAREAGGHLNSKPLGGWGGYGSENEALTGKTIQTPPDIVDTPGGGGTPPGGPGEHGWEPTDPRLPPDVPTTGDGGVRDPTSHGEPAVPGPPRLPGSDGVVPVPPRGGSGGGSGGGAGGGGVGGPPGGGGQRYPTDNMTMAGGDKWAAPAPGGDGTMSGSGSFGGGGGGLGPGPDMAASRATTSQWDDPRMGDSFYRSEMKKQEAGGKATEAYSEKATSAMLQDPKIKATYDGLKALGYKTYLPEVGELYAVFKDTEFQPEDLLKHYELLIKSRGGDENRVGSAGHGAEFRNLKEGLVPRLREGRYGTPAWSTDESAANPIAPSARPESQFANVKFDPLGNAGVASSAPQSYDAQQAKWDRTFGRAKAAAAQKSAVAPARGSTGGLNLSAAPGEGGYASAMTSIGVAPNGDVAASGRGSATPIESGAPTTDTTVWDGTGGRDGTPPPGEGDQDPDAMWKRIFGMLQQKFPDTDPQELYDKYHQYVVDGAKYGYDDLWRADPLGQELAAIANPPVTPTSDKLGARPSQFGPQGFNPTMVRDPLTGEMKPIDPSEMTTDGGYAVGDAWSTSPEWRPEEPTGGLYGAYTELAGGKQTEYENAILNDWRNRAEGPMSELDADTLSSIKTFGNTPGRGEDEAYGAYNDMLQGGYSASEQNAIAQEGMRAARAGFETNRDAMLRNQARTNNSAGYAANMGKMARGFSETMGSQARQNQIDFADEAQRRKEGGASGMLNVAGLANQRGSTALGAQQQFGQEQARQKETALGGMQQAAGYGRDLQQRGLQGLQTMAAAQDPTKQWATAAGIGSAPRETYNETGSASL